tara:strand:- start:43610 stop:45646 length:2037 start_codon:yes stop_codon:yes gene_type:complete
LENQHFSNALINESSPYLLQHAYNPVDWHAWNTDTLAEAKNSNKLMIVSIGYAACHWCHVMEHESFEDETVAAVMNKSYISVKIDREERPDIDQIYINAVQLMTGNAGWPLNVVTLPDGRPVWGGTYFRKNQWIEALEQIQEVYKKQPNKLVEYANRLEAGIKNMDLVSLNETKIDLSNFPIESIIDTWSKNFDYRFGGTKGAPKFMMPNNYQFLLRYAWQNKQSELLNHVLFTLEQMAYGGIYDHIGGGFARYSVDEKWHVPHFEKMLYDNAQLVSLYSQAYAISKKSLFKSVVEETLEFIDREMTGPNGEFYSSLDADSLNNFNVLEEGAYYIYTKEELTKLLQDDFKIFQYYYNVNSFGKWENDKYVLIRHTDDDEILTEFSITSEAFQKKKKKWKKLLLEYRNRRPKPRLDDKTLTSWNALTLKAYVDAYKFLGNATYKLTAIKNATFIASSQIQKTGELYHNYKDGKSNINGFLEDYATVIEAYLSLYEVTLDVKWLQISRKLTEITFTDFYDDKTGMFFFTSKKDPELITRNFEYRDNVIPASSSIMANNLMKLSHYYSNKKYDDIAQQMLQNILPEIEKYPGGFSNWLDLLENYRTNFYEIVVVGAEVLEKIEEINTLYIPNKIIAGTREINDFNLFKNRGIKNKTPIYVCVNNSCKTPVNSVAEVIKSIE